MLYAVIIGAGVHRSPDLLELPAATRDAMALAAALRDGDRSAQITCLIGEDATLEEARSALRVAVESLRADDMLLVTFSGHGRPDGCLMLYDSLPGEQESGWALEEIAQSWNAASEGTAIFLLDSCFSTGISTRAWRGTAVDRRAALDTLAGPGRVFLTAAAANAEAFENPRSRHGFLSEAFLDVLSSRVAGASPLETLGRVMDEASGRAATFGYLQTPGIVGEVTPDLRLPSLVKGQTFDATFPQSPMARIEGPLEELAGVGLPNDLIEAWVDRFPTLNDLQLEAINEHELLQGASLFVAAPTSSGKTFLGELASAQALLDHRKVAYLAPYRAIVTEKADEFEALYRDRLGFRVRRASGDWRDDTPSIRAGKFDLGVFTFEAFLGTILRDPVILDQLGVVVLDEAHFIADPQRGIVVELILTALRQARERGASLQILLLSAVIGDTNGLERWLGCRLLRTDQRPVPLVEGVLTPDGVYRFRSDDGREGEERLIAPLSGRGARAKDFLIPLSRDLAGRGEKLVVFRSGRGTASGSAGYLAREAGLPAAQVGSEIPQDDMSSRTRELRNALGGGVAFHTSDLSLTERSIVEEAFRDPGSGLDVLVATTTLAAGVNLPASTVVIPETSFPGPTGRAFSVGEYKNMVGRAGRLGQRESGRSVLLAETRREAANLFERYVLGQPEDVRSSFEERDLGTWVIKLLARVRAVERTAVGPLLSSTFGGWLREREDPSWTSRLAQEIALLIESFIGAGLLEEEGSHVRLTQLGAASGAASFDLGSALALLEMLGGDAGWIDRPERLAIAIQALPALDEGYTPMHSRGEPDRQRELSYQSSVPHALLARGTYDPRQRNARAKRALVVEAWLRGDAIEAIEAAYSVHPSYGGLRAGDIRSIADRTRYHLASALTIAAIASPDRSFSGEDGMAFLRRLDLGVPEAWIALIERFPGLSRGECRALQAAQAGPAESDAAWLARVIGQTRCDEILETEGPPL